MEGKAAEAKSEAAAAAAAATRDEAADTAAGVKQRLSTLAQRFDGFEDQLEQRRKKKQDEWERQVAALQRQIDETRAEAALEKQNSAAALQALQRWLEARLQEWGERIERPVTERLKAVNIRIDELAAQVRRLDRKIDEEAAKFPRMVEERSAALQSGIAELRQLCDAETRAREEKDRETLSRLVEQGDKLTKLIETERGVREQRQAALSVELEREANLRAKGHALVRQQLADEVAPLRVRIEAEETGRKAVDAELLAAVQHYAAALQDCIRRVSLS